MRETCCRINNKIVWIKMLKVENFDPRGTLQIVIQEVCVQYGGSYLAILSLPFAAVKWHSDPWLVTVTSKAIRLFHQFHDLDTKLDLYWITSGVLGAFTTGMACKQGTLTLPDTWYCPFFGFAYAPIDGTSFLELAASFLNFFHLEYPSVLSQLCFKKLWINQSRWYILTTCFLWVMGYRLYQLQYW